MGLVGESGCGKSTVALGVMQDLGSERSHCCGALYKFKVIDDLNQYCTSVRGNNISFISQEPMTSLNPLHTIEKQLGESLAIHQGLRGLVLQGSYFGVIVKGWDSRSNHAFKVLSTSTVRWAEAKSYDCYGSGLNHHFLYWMSQQQL